LYFDGSSIEQTAAKVKQLPSLFNNLSCFWGRFWVGLALLALRRISFIAKTLPASIMTSSFEKTVTAGIIIIGDEILKGQVQVSML
jgi:hypothetical protein